MQKLSRTATLSVLLLLTWLALPASSQDTLSAQVLRLLDRANTWSQPQTFTGGIVGVVQPTTTATGCVGYLCRTTTVLTAAQVKALFTTPIALTTAPAAGQVAIVHQVVFASTFVSAAYVGTNALEFRYTNASGAKVTADIPAATLNFSSGTKYSTVAGVTTELLPVANSAIVVDVPVANPTAGDSPVTLVVEYEVVVAP